MKVNSKDINPITKLDYPDPDVIRVNDTYYMVSTTMHFMPGCEILRSYDLVHWEHAAYVYDALDHTPGQRLQEDENIYGKGMWAATIRYHQGIFYICFVANDTHKTYVYMSQSIEGPWKKQEIEGFYHDASLLFDEDKNYIVYGNKAIYVTELKADLSGPKEGGVHKKIVWDKDNPILGYEGSHLYKINGKYYVFFIHSRADRWMRCEACFVSDTIDGEYTGGDVLEDTMGYCGQGVAQGGIVDTPEGDWYAILFQDRGAVGRIPVLLPIHWEGDYPVFGENGKVPEEFDVTPTRENHEYQPLVYSDDFKNTYDNLYSMAPCWQFNHEPWEGFYRFNHEAGYYEIITAKLCEKVTQAPNTLTQRMRFPSCEGVVTLDASMIKEGDYAGIAAFQGCYGMIAVTKQNGTYHLVMQSKTEDNSKMNATNSKQKEYTEWANITLSSPVVTLKVAVNFDQMADVADFYYQTENGFEKLGITQKLYFKLDHFCGCRFGLFHYATKELGGSSRFSKFTYL